MFHTKSVGFLAATAVVFGVGFSAQGEVVIEAVTVGNPGNAGEWAGEGYGGYGLDRFCGAVDYVYSIGKFEVTAGQYTEFLNAVATQDTYELYDTDMDVNVHPLGCNIVRSGSPGSYVYSVAGDWADRPVSFVLWGDAARFCNWLHNGQPEGAQEVSTTEDGSYYLNGAMSDAELIAITREPDATWVIPTEDEWYKAAYHYNDGVTGNYYDYPTSSNSTPSNDLIDPDPGNNANCYQFDYSIGSPYWRTVVGDFENSESPYGTFDQGGNVWEWNETVIDSYRGVRGDSFNFEDYGLFMGAAYRNYMLPTHEEWYYPTGFRVVEVSPEPEPQACCMPDHACVMSDPVDCVDAGGEPQGDGTACGDIEACCFSDGTCVDRDPLCCDEEGGEPGVEGVCTGDGDGDGIDDACQPFPIEYAAIMELFPEGASGTHTIVGNEIILASDELPQCVQIAAYARDWAPAAVEAHQTRIDCATYDTGAAGTVTAVSSDCTPGPCALCTTGIDEGRGDYILASYPTLGACDTTAMCPDGVSGWYRCASTTMTQGASDPGSPRYLNHYAFEVSADAKGTWEVSFDPSPDYTQLWDRTMGWLVPLGTFPAFITIDTGRCCGDPAVAGNLGCDDSLTASECTDVGGESFTSGESCSLLDCQPNGMDDLCDLETGVSLDCNLNNVPDECDIAGSTSEDCQPNGVPDECELDTDGDGDIDDCDGDDDNDCVLDGDDEAPLDPNSCEDLDGDTCDDCSVGVDGFGPACDNDPSDDGTDDDEDGICNAGDNCDLPNPEQTDCQPNGIGDVCDIADCTGDQWCDDCNANSVPDGCDISGSTSDDLNGNGVPDECDVKRPLAEDCASIAPGNRCSTSGTCAADGDCASESHCLPSPMIQPGFGAVCYVPKARYLSIARNPEQLPDTARRVRLSDDATIGWVGEPYWGAPTSQHDGLWLADIQATPAYETAWPDLVHVVGCQIGHAGLCDTSSEHCGPNLCPGDETCVHHSYSIQAIAQGYDISNEAYYSEVLELRTPTTWGDVVSTCADNICKPPNGVVGLDDVQAAISLYQGEPVAPITWLDIDPSNAAQTPNQNVGIGDILKVIDGFQGQPYPGDGPLGCP
jgi:formylglycine-generating enzyme required for sulfatase activity